MAVEVKADTIVRSVETLLAEKVAVQEKEKGLIKDLNGVLSRMGYEVVPVRDGRVGVKRRRRRKGPGRPRGRRRGRPPLSGRRRRRGRPPKVAEK
jgi:hypothetical protein